MDPCDRLCGVLYGNLLIKEKWPARALQAGYNQNCGERKMLTKLLSSPCNQNYTFHHTSNGHPGTSNSIRCCQLLIPLNTNINPYIQQSLTHLILYRRVQLAKFEIFFPLALNTTLLNLHRLPFLRSSPQCLLTILYVNTNTFAKAIFQQYPTEMAY